MLAEKFDGCDHELIRSLVKLEQPCLDELKIDLPLRYQNTPPELYYLWVI